MTKLSSEPHLYEVAQEANDKKVLDAYAAACPEYPHPYGDGLVRIWCPSKREFVDSAAFGCDSSLPDVWGQKIGIPAVMMLLTSAEGSYHRHKRGYTPPADEFVGRWHGECVKTAWTHGPIYYDVSGKKTTDWKQCAADTDISRLILTYLDAQWQPLRRLEPDRLKEIIYSLRYPDTDDFTWLNVRDMWALRMLCRRRKVGTWTRLRSWLMRQKLTDEVRRALGGRPGRLLHNQRRKQSLRDGRNARRVKTTRKGG